MPHLRWGPGPVFVYESIVATRRWQFYALRFLFVLGLLSALAMGWYMTDDLSQIAGTASGGLTMRQLASLGQSFYYAIATTQLVLVLLVAPAATAGSICLDRARGTLTHICATDLTDWEIVLGKLGARLLPVLSLVVATVPVIALAGLLGGIIIEAIVTLTMITLTLAVFGCTLALAISVRATKTQEVLMAVYGIEGLWVMGPLVWMLLAQTRVCPGVPAWFVAINPFVLAWAPYAWPNYLGTGQFAAILAGTLALSALFVVYAVLRLRAEVTGRSGVRATRLSLWLERAGSRLSAWRRRPSLENNPLLWREWRRGRPSRLARVVWTLYIGLALAGTGWGIITLADDFRGGSQFLLFINGFQATFGLMLVSLQAPTVLAEERVRGSLDVLLATPLSTGRIVLAKWWGAYRHVPALALLPAIGAVFIAAAEPSFPIRPGRFSQSTVPLGLIDRIAHVAIPLAMLLAQGAVIASVGLALATWIHRLGRAIAVSVASYSFFAFGWLVLLEMEIVTAALSWLGFFRPDDHNAEQFVAQLAAIACPLGGQLCPFAFTFIAPGESRDAVYLGETVMLLGTILIALVILALTLATFDRCLGRPSERPRRAPQPPRRSTTKKRGPHMQVIDERQRDITSKSLAAAEPRRP
jgi:ABC-type transport system involved in multi-copper enzyme maturation permease subunit